MTTAWKLSSLCLLICFSSLLLAGVAAAQAPDFSDTPDILNGERSLLQTDDLAVTTSLLPTTSPYDAAAYTSWLLTANSAITAVQAVAATSVLTGPVTAAADLAIGHLFDLPNDVAAVVAVDAGPPTGEGPILAVTLYDRLGNRQLRQPIASAAPLGEPNALIETLMADFTGDGYDDLAVTYAGGGDGSLSQTVILSAVDPTNWAAGLVVGQPFIWGQQLVSLAAADVDGNSTPELITVSNGVAPDGFGGAIQVLVIQPQTLYPMLQSSTPPASGGLINVVVSGNFDDNPADDEVVLVSGQVGGTQNIAVQLYDFPSSPPSPVLLDQVQVPVPILTAIAADSAAVHPLGGDSTAVVFAAQSIDGSGLVSFLTVAGNQFVAQPTLSYENNDLYDLVLGRFDHRTPAGAIDPNLQLALYGQGIGQPNATLSLFDIGSAGAGYTLTVASTLSLTPPVAQPAALAAGDLQGRSLLLGQPRKITINSHSAPSTIVGMPPMHIDWVVPSCDDPKYSNNCTNPNVVSILTKPASNYAQLNTAVKGSSQSSSQKTTSYSLATQETVNAKLSYGVPFVGSVSVDVKDAARQLHARSVATAQNSYAAYAFDSSVRTGFADHVWFDNYRFNVWTYPVLNRKVCPETKPNCIPSEEVPLHVQFSGPDQIQSFNLDGSVVEWYQPVWEPGNVLSYPWTAAQLAAQLPRSTVNNSSNVWAADSSGSNASVTWSQGGGQNVSQGSTTTFSNDASVTVAASASIAGFGISGSTSFDATTSKSTQTFNTASSTRGSSTGFSVAKTEQGVEDYVYAAQTFILGQTPLSGTLQTLPLTATVQTPGALRLAFWANPFDAVVGGDWWPAAYALPDVALNHPLRWTWTSNHEQPNIMTFNHVVTSTSPYDQEFYFMRGLFVTSAGSPSGPQLTTAPVTETVLLQAAVYNYSHVDMDAGSLASPAAAVKVRFYGQLFRSDSGDYPTGESFLIGERTLAPLPGFASTTTPGDLPNRGVAIQAFNPADFAQTRAGGVYVRFWVVVWMEDAAGALVPEMAGHGLAADPRSITINTLGDIPVEPYSNNAGTLKQVFYIPPIATASGANARGGPQAGGSGEISAQGGAAAPPSLALSSQLAVPPAQPPTVAGPLGKHLLTTQLRTATTALEAVQLLYYDGDPAAGGHLFDWELVPYIAANATYTNRVIYTPSACGNRTLYVVATTAVSPPATATLALANVPCVQILPWISRR